VVGGEHDADGRDGDVEAVVREGQLLGGGLDEVHVQPLSGRPLPCDVEQLGHVVDSGRPGTHPGGSDRGMAGAGGDVEHVLSGRDPRARHQGLVHRHGQRGDPVVVPRTPHLLLLGAQLGEHLGVVGLGSGHDGSFQVVVGRQPVLRPLRRR
jgi:hypothetical protein